MNISQPHLKIREDPKINSCTLWNCPTPQNIRTGNPAIWYKKQGRSFNYIEFVVDLIDATGDGARNLYLTTTLLYANKRPVTHQNALNIVNDATVRIDENTRMIRIDEITKQAIVRCRIEEVSSRHQGQLFCIKVSANRASGLLAAEICPDISSFIEVRSRPPEAIQSTDFRASPDISLHDNTSHLLSSSTMMSNTYHRTQVISNLINWDTFFLKTVDQLRIINSQRSVNVEEMYWFLDQLTSGYNNHDVHNSLMCLKQEINQSQFSSTQEQHNQSILVHPHPPVPVPVPPATTTTTAIPVVTNYDYGNDYDCDSSISSTTATTTTRKSQGQGCIIPTDDNDNDNESVYSLGDDHCYNTSSSSSSCTITDLTALSISHSIDTTTTTTPTIPPISLILNDNDGDGDDFDFDSDLADITRALPCHPDTRQTTQELSDGRPYKRNQHNVVDDNDDDDDDMASILSEPLPVRRGSTIDDWTKNAHNLDR
eukprot:gene8696-17964_t